MSGSHTVSDMLATDSPGGSDSVFIDFAEMRAADATPIDLASIVTAKVLQDVALVA